MKNYIIILLKMRASRDKWRVIERKPKITRVRDGEARYFPGDAGPADLRYAHLSLSLSSSRSPTYVSQLAARALIISL